MLSGLSVQSHWVFLAITGAPVFGAFVILVLFIWFGPKQPVKSKQNDRKDGVELRDSTKKR